MYLAPLNYDRFFKKVFSDKKIAKRFLEDFLEVEITEMEILKEKHRVTDDAAIIEFDYRCKIQGSHVIIDMQQWYKQDIGQRFYLYHALNTGLQLEALPKMKMAVDALGKKFVEVRDYRALEPVITLVWMVMDSMNFRDDYVSYAMTPDLAVDFLKTDHLWQASQFTELLKARENVLQVIANESKGLGFLPRNRLIFMYQRNIVKNKAIKKYERWFEFAEKTRRTNNKKEDFSEYETDETFCEIIRRLNKAELTEDDITYIDTEKDYWDKYTAFFNGIYEDGLLDGKTIGRQEGKKEGIEEGKKEGIEEGKKEGKKEGIEEGLKKAALNMLKLGTPIEDISKITGFPNETIQSWCP